MIERKSFFLKKKTKPKPKNKQIIYGIPKTQVVDYYKTEAARIVSKLGAVSCEKVRRRVFIFAPLLSAIFFFKKNVNFYFP